MNPKWQSGSLRVGVDGEHVHVCAYSLRLCSVIMDISLCNPVWSAASRRCKNGTPSPFMSRCCALINDHRCSVVGWLPFSYVIEEIKGHVTY